MSARAAVAAKAAAPTGRLNGRAVLHRDKRPGGWFRYMARGVEGTWEADAFPVYRTAAEREEREREWNAAKTATARARRRAAPIWQPR